MSGDGGQNWRGGGAAATASSTIASPKPPNITTRKRLSSIQSGRVSLASSRRSLFNSLGGSSSGFQQRRHDSKTNLPPLNTNPNQLKQNLIDLNLEIEKIREQEKNCFSKYSQKYFTCIELFKKIDPSMNFVKHQLIEHKMILQALFESLVDDDQRKIINFGNDDKQMCKIDLNSIKNFPETMIETLNESVLKFSSPLKFLSPNSFEVLDTYIVSLYSTHFLICCRGKESDDTKHPNLHFKHLIGIDNCKIITVKDGDSTVKNIFQILTSDMTLIFQASSLFLKNQWESIFEELGILKKRRRNVLSTMGSSAELHKCEEKYTFEQYQELIEYPKILKEQIIKCRYLEAAKKIENFYSTYFVQQCDSKYHYIFDSVKSMKLELISKIKKFFTEIDDNHLFQNLTHQRNCFKSLMIIGKSFEAQDLYFSRQSTLLDFRIRKTLLDDSSSNGIIYNIFFTTFSHVNEVYEFFYEMMSINCIEYFIIWATNKIKMMLDISRSYLFRSSIPLKSSTDSLQRAIKLAKTMPSFNIPILFLFDEVLHEEILLNLKNEFLRFQVFIDNFSSKNWEKLESFDSSKCKLFKKLLFTEDKKKTIEGFVGKKFCVASMMIFSEFCHIKNFLLTICDFFPQQIVIYYLGRFLKLLDCKLTNKKNKKDYEVDFFHKVILHKCEFGFKYKFDLNSIDLDEKIPSVPPLRSKSEDPKAEKMKEKDVIEKKPEIKIPERRSPRSKDFETKQSARRDSPKATGGFEYLESDNSLELRNKQGSSNDLSKKSPDLVKPITGKSQIESPEAIKKIDDKKISDSNADNKDKMRDVDAKSTNPITVPSSPVVVPIRRRRIAPEPSSTKTSPDSESTTAKPQQVHVPPVRRRPKS